MSDVMYEDIRVSLFAIAKQFITDMVALGIMAGPAPEPFNYDAHAENQILPEWDLIGVSSLNVVLNGQLAEVTCAFGVATSGDPNLFRLEKMVGLLMKRLAPRNKLPLLDADGSPNPTGLMTVADGTEASPVLRAEQRPLKFVGVTMRASRAFS